MVKVLCKISTTIYLYLFPLAKIKSLINLIRENIKQTMEEKRGN